MKQKTELPVNFNATHEQPLADLSESAAKAAEAAMHTTSMWDARPAADALPSRLHPIDVAIWLLVKARKARAVKFTDSEIAAAFNLDVSHVKKIYATTAQHIARRKIE
jgi:hypothetical protein